MQDGERENIPARSTETPYRLPTWSAPAASYSAAATCSTALPNTPDIPAPTVTYTHTAITDNDDDGSAFSELGSSIEDPADAPSGSVSDVSRGGGTPPESPMNADYQYALPSHLALFTQPHSPREPGCGGGMCAASSGAGAGPFALQCVQRSASASDSDPESSGNSTSDAPSACEGSALLDVNRSLSDLLPKNLHAHAVHAHGRPLTHKDALAKACGDAHARMHVCKDVRSAPTSRGQSPVGTPLSWGGVGRGREGGPWGSTMSVSPGTGGLERISFGLAPLTDITQDTTDLATGTHAVRQLHRQLDSFGRGDLFLDQFEMLGQHFRRRGGELFACLYITCRAVSVCHLPVSPTDCLASYTHRFPMVSV